MIRILSNIAPFRPLLCAASLLVFAGWASDAGAQLEECGDLRLEAGARCEVKVEGGCEGACEPPQLDVACAGELQVDCRGECNAEYDAVCFIGCQGDCEAECDLDPGSFSCEGRCEVDCKGSCDAHCTAADNKGECEASCEGTCNSECQAQCDVTPPSGSCQARCEGSCQGACRAEARIDCQGECQAKGFASCKVALQDKCELQCQRPEGVVLCDGQFVDAPDVTDCVAALEAALGVEVMVDATAEGSCGDGTCEGEASVSATCGIGTPQTSRTGTWYVAAGLAMLLVRRRR